ncbi:hypothetical protein DOTSEDRAFT_73600 [Dothistroma septosporum NZE10]|uniref:RING-type domain-containing protein n=1 Tax=Dothistroma septosporum (strain NZE10 / CBS 128990) TaxID=675120 RepID=N1PI85_DOTSN|nr:hypothetical protein DOTSEDRAFT_73600 [Dothistroma septosporum NZE10]
MGPLSRKLGAALLVTLASLLMATAQTISPTNTTSGATLQHVGLEDAIGIAISQNEHAAPMAIFPVAGLTAESQQYTPQAGLSGNIVLANASSQLTIAQNDIVLISCDPYSGNIQPQNVFDSATGTNVRAIVLFSEQTTGCLLSGSATGYQRVYSLINQGNASDMVGIVNSQDANAPAYAQVAPREALANIAQQSNNGTNGQNNHQNPLGPSPSTAVAMIILYSITGIITALFLVIIITGAVRAHRHPERYGPRNGVGRPRQSRARGLARAMLETIPIVKFGDREGDNVKPADVESAVRRHGSVEMVPVQDGTQAGTHGIAATDGTARDVNAEPTDSERVDQSGIAAAATPAVAAPVEENPGCSICTEEFQRGEDQRVLPCDHRFHPACIDPWLLNVSGTCPLCRIDLRPQNARDSVDGTDEHGTTIRRDENGERLAPPLAESDGSRRISVRRSLIHGLIGARPERMTREERVAALRRYREQQGARADEQQQRTDRALDEETSVRARLRNAFRIRTRRTGENGQTVETEQTVAPADAAQNDNSPSRLS